VKVLIVTGIWPPDVGGPASHAPEIAEFLRARGHEVEVLTTADGPPAPEAYPVTWVPRRLSAAGRYAKGAMLAARLARRNDVVYSTGMFGRTRVGTFLARAPRVLKLTGDPAYERATRYGLTRMPLDDFQRSHGAKLVGLRAARDLVMSGARGYVCPSRSLRDIAAHWHLVDAARIEVIPNPVSVPPLPARDELRAKHGFSGPTLVFAGRLAPQKSMDVALRALAELEGIDLVVAGDGPERPALDALVAELEIGDRVRFLGALPRETVLELFAAGDAVLLTSSWENFPHGVVEGLAAGTPVISTDVGGVSEIVTDGVNGLLVPPQDVPALVAAVRRYFGDEALRERLRAAAGTSTDDYSPERIFGRIEELLREAAR
jgi:glycosyltransferase involved in cell wall biosynthesis